MPPMTKEQKRAYNKIYYANNKAAVDKKNKEAKAKRLSDISAYNKAYYAKTRLARSEAEKSKIRFTKLPIGLIL